MQPVIGHCANLKFGCRFGKQSAVARGRLETALSRLADVERRGETAPEQDLALIP